MVTDETDIRLRGPLEARLTNRQVTILLLMAQGCSNKEIATLLYPPIQETTVKTHVATILGKSGLKNRAQAGDYCHLFGLK